MRNRKAYFLVACILVVALVASLVIGCTPKSEGPKGNGSFSGGSVQDPFEGAIDVENADKYIQFELYAEKAMDVADRVHVVDLTGSEIDVAVVSLGSGIYRVHAPNGGYDLDTTYVIMLDDGVSFIDYAAQKVRFTVTIDTLSNIEFKGDTLVIGSELVNKLERKGNLADGTEYGSVRVQNNGKFVLKAGQVFIVDNVKTGLQQAYEVKNIDEMGGMYLIDYVKPNLEDIYSEFTYQSSEVLDKDNENQLLFKDEAAIEEELANSNVAQMIGGVFGAAPTFNVDVKLEGKEVVANITITIADVVYTNNGSADLVLSVQNRLSAVANSSISNNKINNKYDVAFDVNADIANKVIFNVGVISSGSYSRVDNIQGIIDQMQIKMDEIQNKEDIVNKIADVNAKMENEDSTNVKIFKWTLPIANGAAAISYDADLALNFGFSGNFGVSAETTLNYTVGASYNINDGIDAYVKEAEDNKPCDKVSVKIDGRVDAKVGINQRIGLDVLAGVLGIGIRANVGNFNRLYGYADAAWEAAGQPDENGAYNMIVKDAFDGTMYLEGGVYWDVNVDAGVKVGALIKLDALKDTNVNKSFNVSTGEKILYTAGSQEIVRGLEAAQPVISAKNSTLSFNKLVYNILSKKDNVAIAIDSADVAVTKVDDTSAKFYDLKNENGNWMVSMKTDELDFALNVVYSYKDAFGQDRTAEEVINYHYTAALSFENDSYKYNKSAIAKNNLEFVVYTKVAPEKVEIDGNAVDFTTSIVGDECTVSVPFKTLDKLYNGSKDLTVTVNGESVTAELNVEGIVNVKNVKEENGTAWEIYAPDQIKGLLTMSYASTDYFTIVDDIDMNGAELTTLPVFKGNIEGNGHVISNYTIKNTTAPATVGKYNTQYAAVIGVNEGSIKNVKFIGNVDLTLKVATNSNYYVAGVVGVNEGELVNVNFNGSVKVNSVGLQSYTDVYVGTIAAVNNNTMTDCTVNDTTKLVVNYKFDLAGMKFIVSGSNDRNVVFEGACEAGVYNNITKVDRK